MTQHVGTRISAQVRSHAQKVLKDYSPNQDDDVDIDYRHEVGSKNEMTDQLNTDTLNLPKDLTLRTDEPNFAHGRLEIGL